MRKDTLPDLDNALVTVMGLGRFGGGLGVTKWLCSQGARVLVTDLADAGSLEQPLSELRDEIERGSVRLRLGEHRDEDFTSCDLVIANPSVRRPLGNRYLCIARDAGVTITTEIALAIAGLPNRDRVIGVTGTVGKSTVCAMITEAMRASDVAAHLGGNIGGSLLTDLQHISSQDAVVLELSSAQLWWIAHDSRMQDWSPRVGVVTGFSPNHLDWHDGLDEYMHAKKRLIARQVVGDTAVLGASVRDWRTAQGVTRIEIPAGGDDRFDPLPPVCEPRVLRENATTALEATSAIIENHITGASLEQYETLPHRLQFVAEVHGVRYFNDSKSTTPDAALAAVASFPDRHIHVLCGGADKGTDPGALLEITKSSTSVYAFGTTGEAIARVCNAEGNPIASQAFADLAAAFDAATTAAQRGDIVLLSPGHASWDQFTNYEQRGRTFVSLVEALA